ncbi:MAG: PaaI family thioesterase [Pseudomonadota bacterium]
MTEDTLAARLQPLIDHPLHQQLGMHEVRSQDGAGHLAIVVNAHSCSPAGGLHGGVVYLLSDVCAMVGLLSRLPAGAHAVTHDIQVSVMRSAALGAHVCFDSHIVQLGRRLCFCEVVVRSGDRTLATAKVTKSLLQP